VSVFLSSSLIYSLHISFPSLPFAATRNGRHQQLRITL
jgi:hypothetical protein